MKRLHGDPARVFGNKQPAAQLARLMIAVNALETMHRAFDWASHSTHQHCFGKSVSTGDATVIFGLLCGAIAESLTAYHCCKGQVAKLALAFDASLRKQVEFLENFPPKKASFPQAVVKRIRDSAGFHWDESAVLAVLQSFGGKVQELYTSEKGADGAEYARYTFADSLLATVAATTTETERVDFEKWALEVAEVRTVRGCLVEVLEAAIAELMRRSNCKTSGE